VDVALHERLRTLFATYLADNRLAWDLDSSGQYRQRSAGSEPERNAQTILMNHPWGDAAPVVPTPSSVPVMTTAEREIAVAVGSE
jgi:hypothetical protein